MIALIQRVTNAKVVVDGATIGAIEQGLLALIGVQPNDDIAAVERMAKRLLGYRVFADADGKMNLGLEQIKGGLLLVPQFTLAASTAKGMRPSFSSAAPPQLGETIFNQLVEHCRSVYPKIATGQFGADMQVSLVNDGPVTFWLEV